MTEEMLKDSRELETAYKVYKVAERNGNAGEAAPMRHWPQELRRLIDEGADTLYGLLLYLKGEMPDIRGEAEAFQSVVDLLPTDPLFDRDNGKEIADALSLFLERVSNYLHDSQGG